MSESDSASASPEDSDSGSSSDQSLSTSEPEQSTSPKTVAVKLVAGDVTLYESAGNVHQPIDDGKLKAAIEAVRRILEEDPSDGSRGLTNTNEKEKEKEREEIAAKDYHSLLPRQQDSYPVARILRHPLYSHVDEDSPNQTRVRVETFAQPSTGWFRRNVGGDAPLMIQKRKQSQRLPSRNSASSSSSFVWQISNSNANEVENHHPNQFPQTTYPKSAGVVGGKKDLKPVVYPTGGNLQVENDDDDDGSEDEELMRRQMIADSVLFHMSKKMENRVAQLKEDLKGNRVRAHVPHVSAFSRHSTLLDHDDLSDGSEGMPHDALSD